MPLTCPDCGLINSDRSVLCDCGRVLNAAGDAASAAFVRRRRRLADAFAASFAGASSKTPMK